MDTDDVGRRTRRGGCARATTTPRTALTPLPPPLLLLLPLTMSDHQIKHVFTRVTCPKKLAACTDLLVQTAEANGMIPLTPDVELRWVQTDDSRLIPAVYKAGTEVRIHSKGNPFACSIMFEAEVMKKYVGPRIMEEGVTGNTKQMLHTEGVGADKLIDLYNRWPEAAAKCKGHAVRKMMKQKNPTDAQVAEFCGRLVESGKVFLPIGENGEDSAGNPRKTFKASNKIVKSNGKYVRPVDTGFEGDVLDEFFALNPNAGLSLLKFIGRDGKEWKGKPEDIGKIHKGFVGVHLFSDYFAAKIGKYTMPMRTPLVLCIDVETNISGASSFVMPDMQALAGMQTEEETTFESAMQLVTPAEVAVGAPAGVAANASEDEEDDGGVDGFIASRKRARVG